MTIKYLDIVDFLNKNFKDNHVTISMNDYIKNLPVSLLSEELRSTASINQTNITVKPILPEYPRFAPDITLTGSASAIQDLIKDFVVSDYLEADGKILMLSDFDKITNSKVWQDFIKEN